MNSPTSAIFCLLTKRSFMLKNRNECRVNHRRCQLWPTELHFVGPCTSQAVSRQRKLYNLAIVSPRRLAHPTITFCYWGSNSIFSAQNKFQYMFFVVFNLQCRRTSNIEQEASSRGILCYLWESYACTYVCVSVCVCVSSLDTWDAWGVMQNTHTHVCAGE